ncbi:MAG TPA: ATP-binding cassette domain-containing protein, partial [Acidimicrobiales bacterium]|nr:ATP-binding cassette domain-containing protein [Acidimicrobiales bacterium]
MSALLEVDRLVVRYPVPRGIVGTFARRAAESVHAVDGVSFELRAGEMVALVGESGCGKTSTAQAVMRLVDAEAGTIRFEGRDLTGLGVRALRPLRRRIQMVYQDPYESLDPRLRVRQAVEEPLVIHRLGASRKERDDLVRQALSRVELTPPELYLDRYPHELSGGQRQR